jgi:hypothetical protein
VVHIRAITVTLEFQLAEDVTPTHLAQRVTEACAVYGALRPGESVLEPTTRNVYIVTNVPTPNLFDA